MKKVFMGDNYLGIKWLISKKPYTSWRALGVVVVIAAIAAVLMLRIKI